MDVGFLLPYFLLTLVVLEEHYAMWFVFFFVIPLLDIMFYVEIPDKNVFDTYWCRMCMWLWFPLVMYAAYFSECSFQSMISLGVLHNTSLCIADELENSGLWYDHCLKSFIYEFMGFVEFNYYSFTRSILCFLIMFVNNRLLWYAGSIVIGSVLYEYVCLIENVFYNHDEAETSHYGLGNYTMFRLKHSNTQLLPTSHMWVFPYSFLKKMGSYFKID
jgi:hypothetical protein